MTCMSQVSGGVGFFFFSVSSTAQEKSGCKMVIFMQTKVCDGVCKSLRCEVILRLTVTP